MSEFNQDGSPVSEPSTNGLTATEAYYKALADQIAEYDQAIENEMEQDFDRGGR